MKKILALPPLLRVVPWLHKLFGILGACKGPAVVLRAQFLARLGLRVYRHGVRALVLSHVLVLSDELLQKVLL